MCQTGTNWFFSNICSTFGTFVSFNRLHKSLFFHWLGFFDSKRLSIYALYGIAVYGIQWSQSQACHKSQLDENKNGNLPVISFLRTDSFFFIQWKIKCIGNAVHIHMN